MNAVAEMKPKKPATDAPRIYAAIAACMAALSKEGIGKDRKNDQQGYKFRGIDDVYNALAPILSQNELVIVPRVLSRDVVERKTAKGNALFYVTCEVEFTLVCSVDGSEVKAVTYGEAMDSGDKATNKAMSAAYKYMAMQTFCIPTEGDNDAEAQTHEVAPARREVQKVVNPATGRMVDPSSPNQQRKNGSWERFCEKVRAFTDLDALENWWADADTQAKVEMLPEHWQMEAAEEYEKAQERLMNAGSP